ncbi:MAG: hypothetical protein AAGG01_23145, partial [Planctomycetota bacterium]
LTEERGFATYRGHAMSPEDRMRRDVILELMCNGRIDKARVEGDHLISFDETFALELSELEPMQTDGLVKLSTDRIELTAIGQVLMRNVAVPFDRYMRERKAKGATDTTFSKTL